MIYKITRTSKLFYLEEGVKIENINWGEGGGVIFISQSDSGQNNAISRGSSCDASFRSQIKIAKTEI